MSGHVLRPGARRAGLAGLVRRGSFRVRPVCLLEELASNLRINESEEIRIDYAAVEESPKIAGLQITEEDFFTAPRTTGTGLPPQHKILPILRSLYES